MVSLKDNPTSCITIVIELKFIITKTYYRTMHRKVEVHHN